jgi:hypothetical protein
VYNDIEVKFGIDAYASSHDGFAAVLKARFSDFCVHEVDMDGNLAELLSVSGSTEDNDAHDKSNVQIPYCLNWLHTIYQLWIMIRVMI